MNLADAVKEFLTAPERRRKLPRWRKVIGECKSCGRDIYNSNGYCRDCLRKGHAKTETIVCAQCGNRFERIIIGLYANRKFCSAKCTTAYHREKGRINTHCKHCGKIIKLSRAVHYCSVECRLEARKIRDRERYLKDRKATEETK